MDAAIGNGFSFPGVPMRLTTERIYLAERLQSARGLGWEMPVSATGGAALSNGPRPTSWGRSLFLRLVEPLLRHLGVVRG
jgi:hypothetical protein